MTHRLKRTPCLRGQMIFEVLVLLSIVLIVFLSLLTLYADKESGYRNAKTYSSADEIARSNARAINRVLQAGNSTWTTVWNPPSLDTGENYSLRMIGRRIEVILGNSTAAALLLTDNFSNSNALVPGRTVRIKNINGVIYFEQT
jgi:Tfp pilus assembly protein PilW